MGRSKESDGQFHDLAGREGSETAVQVVPAKPKQPGPDKVQRCRLRQSVRTAISELLAIILGDPRREVLIAKVQEIERLPDPILSSKKRRMVANRPATSIS
jgi:hypothetical protein